MKILDKINIDQLPEYVREVFNTLSCFYPTYIVGGAVRDIILGLHPKDYDFASQAHPEQVISLFENRGYKVIPTGIDYGTVTVMIGDEPIEITTFRKDSKQNDGRRPTDIEFSDDIIEDLSRRDFTINAMSADINGNILDPHNGYRDLQDKMIRTVGRACDRFAEDKLRMLRAYRFASRFNFGISYDISSEVQLFPDISNLSMERIISELNKIICCDKPSNYLMLSEFLDMISSVIPELDDLYYLRQNNPNHCFNNVYKHSVKAMDKIEPEVHLRLAMLFHDLGKLKTKTTDDNGIDHFNQHEKSSVEMTEIIMRRLKYSNKMIDDVCTLIGSHMIRYENVTPKLARRFLSRMGNRWEDMIKVMIADRLAAVTRFSGLEKVYRLKFECEIVLTKQQPITIKQLALNGNDLIRAGIKEGKEIGVVLNKLKEFVLDNPEFNNRGDLYKQLKKLERR